MSIQVFVTYMLIRRIVRQCMHQKRKKKVVINKSYVFALNLITKRTFLSDKIKKVAVEVKLRFHVIGHPATVPRRPRVA